MDHLVPVIRGGKSTKGRPGIELQSVLAEQLPRTIALHMPERADSLTLIVSDASETGTVPLHDIPQVEEVQLKVAEELHRLANHRSDDGT